MISYQSNLSHWPPEWYLVGGYDYQVPEIRTMAIFASWPELFVSSMGTLGVN